MFLPLITKAHCHLFEVCVKKKLTLHKEYCLKIVRIHVLFTCCHVRVNETMQHFFTRKEKTKKKLVNSKTTTQEHKKCQTTQAKQHTNQNQKSLKITC